MFIKNIKKFLPSYENISEKDLLEILKISNKKDFDQFKFEKDFLLTLVLIKFWEKYPDLIFKGWTCLNKINFPYFRLSEDLDFVINHSKWATSRKTLLRTYENFFIDDLKLLWINLKSKSKSDQYKLAMFTFEYNSVINDSIQTIKIDISLKNNLVLPVISWRIQSIYIDKLLEEPIFWKHFINCIDLKESVAEKLRASLTRITPAIRDFFDVWFIKNNSDFDFEDVEFISLVELKLKEVNFLYTLEENYDLLTKQIYTDLKPVLNNDFEFNFDEIYNFILTFKK
jgi:predicted nucleotidyltransferase component of viral defense system